MPEAQVQMWSPNVSILTRLQAHVVMGVAAMLGICAPKERGDAGLPQGGWKFFTLVERPDDSEPTHRLVP